MFASFHDIVEKYKKSIPQYCCMKPKIIFIIIFSLVVGGVIGFLIGGQENKNYTTLCTEAGASNIILSVCRDSGLEPLEFDVDVNNELRISVTDKDCAEEFQNKFGGSSRGPCLLTGVEPQHDREFIGEFRCECWN